MGKPKAKRTRSHKKQSQKKGSLTARMKRNGALLAELNDSSDRVKTAFLSGMQKDIVETLVEIAQNIVHGNVALTETQLSNLVRLKHHVHQLAFKKNSLNKQRKIIQKGGFLGALLAPLIGTVGSLIAGAVR